METRYTRLTSLNGVCSSLADSPCIGNCTVTQWGDLRCKGCGRTASEVRDWDLLQNTEKKLINIRNAQEGFKIRQLRAEKVLVAPKTPSKQFSAKLDS